MLISRRNFVVAGSAITAAPALALGPDAAERILEYRDIQAAGLPVQRLSIWLPAGYHAATTRYRVLYMHDAQNLFDPALSNFNKVWAADRAMKDHAAKRSEDPWIIVGIWSPGIDRYRQYLPLPAYNMADGTLRAAMDDYAQGPIVSHRYLDWITQALKPWVDSQFRTKPDRDSTAIIGSSMGGLISLYAFLEHRDVFGRAGCVSTHWPAIAPQNVDSTDPELLAIWRSMLAEKLGEPDGRKLWFDLGTATLDAYYPAYQAQIDAFMASTNWRRGHDWESRTYPGAEHEENAWAKRLPDVFDWVLG
ncbi:MAG: alpha/beta hydrolase-fold protein [Pseudomonadota bacterium]|nr:alpha/beta hydrolase-fold protein [Pseudomonadota bacterium]